MGEIQALNQIPKLKKHIKVFTNFFFLQNMPFPKELKDTSQTHLAMSTIRLPYADIHQDMW